MDGWMRRRQKAEKMIKKCTFHPILPLAEVAY